MSYISYRRVSTEEQEISGLGLEAQYKSIVGVFGVPLFDFIEAESTKIDERPELLKAMDMCKKTNSTLVVSRQDRLGRDVYFIALLIRNGIEFKSADNPEAPTFVKHLMASVSEEERRVIRLRTKAALAIKKQQLALEGKRLGCPDMTKTGRTVQDVILENRKNRKYPKPDPAKVEIIKTLKSSGMPMDKIQESAKHIFGRSLSKVTLYSYLK
jgi:DNA invertase Pin-like site-specific DNA recombinase